MVKLEACATVSEKQMFQMKTKLFNIQNGSRPVGYVHCLADELTCHMINEASYKVSDLT